jgi:AsmA protein
MKFNLRAIGICFGALLGVLVVAVGLFLVFFPKDIAAREAERRIEAATGRDLVLGGEVNVSFWPVLGFSVEQASLSNPEGFSAESPFITADRIVFAVAVMPLLAGHVEVRQLIFEGAELRLQAKADGAANWAFPTETSAPEQQTTLEDLRLDDVRMIDGRISFQGADGAAPMLLEDVDASLALESLDAPAQLEAAFDYRGERLNVGGEIGSPRAVLEKGETPLTANVRSDPMNANLDGVFNAATGGLSGRLEANGASVRQLLAWFGSPMGDGGGFGAFRLSAQMAHAGEETALTDAAIRLDDIDARGNLTLINQESGRLRVAGALSSANVDLNTYLPAPTQGAQAGVEVDTAWSAAPLDLSGLRALDANLNLTLGALKFQRMSFADVALNLRIAGGAADARLSRISLYEGGGTARLIADGSGANARVAVEIDAQNIEAETLLRDAIGFDRIAGRGRLTASLVGQGASQAAIMRSLNGNASFNFNDGQWKGVNLAQVARTVQSALTGAAAGEGGSTDFAELAANFAVSNGAMATDNLRMLSPFVRLEGRGIVDIGGQSIDMRITPRAVNSAQGQGGDVSVAGLGIPFRISGPWSRVSYRPALEDVVQSQVRDILGRQAPGSPLGALGDALFGRTPAEPAAATPPAEGAPATPGGEATPATPPAEEERPRNPLEEILRRATQPREKETPPPAPGP